MFLKNPIGCLSSLDDVKSRAIKHFKGRNLLGFYFLEISQSLARAEKNYVSEISLRAHYFMSEKLCSAAFS